MPAIPVRDLGAIGIIKDLNSFSLPPNAFSDGINVRFDNKQLQRAPIFRTLTASLTGTVPVWCYGVYVQSGFDSILYANNDGRLFSIANGTETNVSISGHVNNIDPRAFTGCTLAQCTYVNRPDAVPRVLLPSGAPFVVLPAWTSTWRCVSLRAFKSFLIALNVTKGSTSFPNLFKWSDQALNGAAPASWDETDTTKLAGENPITQLKTPIVDGGPLGDNFIVYSRDEVWKVIYTGGQFIFSFQRLPFDNAGLINQNCWLEIDGKHYAWGENDIYVHNGVTKTSIMADRNRNTFFRELNIQKSGVFYMAHDKYRNEIIFCGVSGAAAASNRNPNGYCNYGAVYNYQNDTWSFRDLPNASFSATANANTVYTYATVPAALTYDNVGGSYFDQEDSFSRFAVFSVVADTPNGISASKIDVLDGADQGKLALALDTEAVHPAWVERTGFDLDTEGADLRSYKQVNALMPLAALYAQNVTLTVQVGGHINSASPVTWDAEVPFDPVTMYKIDTRQGGHFLAHRYKMLTAHDFSVAGHDLDVILTGRKR